MKTRSLRRAQRPGRKRFSAGRQFGLEKDLFENILLAGIGEIATDPAARSAFELVASWNQYGPLLTGKPPAKPLAAARWGKRRERLIQRLTAILDPAFRNLDTKPIEKLKRVIQAVRDVNERGAVSPFERRILLAAMEAGMLTEKMDPTEVLISRQEFKDRFRIDPTQRHMHRLCKKAGTAFQRREAGAEAGAKS